MDSDPRIEAATARRTPIAGVGLALLFALALAALCVFPPSSHAAERDEALASSGIRFPEGFDVNTIGSVKGKVYALTKPESGPVRFKLDSDADTYTAFAAPHAFWRQLGVPVDNGDRVTVRGSRTVGRDGRLYIVVQTIKVEGAKYSYRFRSGDGEPLWTMAGEGGREDRERRRDYKGIKEWRDESDGPGQQIRRGLFR